MYNKLIIAVFTLILGLAFACDDEYTDTVEPSPVVGADVPGLSFSDENKSSFEMDPSESPVVSLTIVRNNAAGSLDAPVTVVENTENSFEVPASVSFASGEKTAQLDIPVKADAPTATPLTLELKFDDAYVNPYTASYPHYIGQVILVKWLKYADGTFTSEFFEESWDQELYREEGANNFRLVDLYEDGTNYEFEWEEGAKEISPAAAVQLSGFVDPTYGLVTTTTSADPANTYYDAEENTFYFFRKWTVSAGSFGELIDTYEITELVE